MGALAYLSLAVFVIGGIGTLIAAFKVSAPWGLACFIPPCRWSSRSCIGMLPRIRFSCSWPGLRLCFSAAIFTKGFPMKVKDLFLLVILGAGALYAYDKFKPAASPQVQDLAQPARRSAPSAAPKPAPASVSTPAPVEDRSWIKPGSEQPSVAMPSPYQCDGRTHCSQMRSCDEAKYFIQHCPNTQMDGDHDGIPCERQWC